MTLILSGTDGLSDVDGSAATPAIRGTDANTGMFFPAADTIGFAEGGAEVARFDSSGNLGIGTTTIGAALTVAKSNSYAGGLLLGQAAVASGYLWTTDNLYIKPNTSANTASGSVLIQNFAGSANQISLSAVNGLIAIGGATPAATGAGITFPATQSASSDANTLDDYEEGTWTASLTANPTPPSSVPTTTGYYTKIGNLVTVFVRFTNVNTSGGSGDMYISGLPFTSANVTENNSSAPMMYGLSVPALYVTGYIGGNVTNINFLGVTNNGAWQTVNITAGASKYLNMSISYRAA